MVYEAPHAPYHLPMMEQEIKTVLDQRGQAIQEELLQPGPLTFAEVCQRIQAIKDRFPLTPEQQAYQNTKFGF
jgi:hypothetical protein